MDLLMVARSYRKPVLPDPGPDRWWEIELDGDYWNLTLYEEAESLPDPETDGRYLISSTTPTVLADETLRTEADAKDFEQSAEAMLRLLDKATAFVGTYHKKEEE